MTGNRLRPIVLLIGAGAFFLAGGCGRTPEFTDNRVWIKRLEIETGLPLGQQEVQDVRLTLEELFGSADSPALPDGVEQVDLLRLQQSAGRVYSDQKDTHFGLYRKHCIRCHGTVGDGQGPAARLLSPYPRDFRLGIFKFKSTPQGNKPTHADLVRTIRNGIPGTSMSSFALLREGELAALADYVIYLSVRGETERDLLSRVALEMDYSRGERLIQFELQTAGQKEFQASLDKLTQEVKLRYSNWSRSGSITPQRTSLFPVARRYELDSQSDLAALDESISRGEQLFVSSLTGCSKCHGLDGSGNDAPKDYDLWTKDWSFSAGIDPENKASIQPMLNAGALKPVPMYPRNLRLGVFRGGQTPEDIFLRIVHGIEGSSMPAIALKPQVADGLSTDQVWDLVNFVFSLSSDSRQSTQFSDEKLRSKTASTDSVNRFETAITGTGQ